MGDYKRNRMLNTFLAHGRGDRQHGIFASLSHGCKITYETIPISVHASKPHLFKMLLRGQILVLPPHSTYVSAY